TSLNWTSAAPAAISAALMRPLEADCFSVIAMLLLFRSDNELISGRVNTSATRLSGSSSDADAAFPISLALSDALAGAGTAGAAAISSVASGGNTTSGFVTGLASDVDALDADASVGCDAA